MVDATVATSIFQTAYGLSPPYILLVYIAGGVSQLDNSDSLSGVIQLSPRKGQNSTSAFAN